ncbi:MAG: AzlC family ABC transporter permease [Candidatus Promineofilum sp.]|nr:AzlC family ABC transporter permease [Promineifilum sp.]
MASLNRSQFLAGVRAELPILVGVVPFGMIFGAIATAGGLTPLLAQSMSSVVFAGSAQFIGAQLMAGGAPVLVLLATTFVVNLRHLLYSASLAPHVQQLPLRWRLLLAYLLTDEAYAVTIVHYTDPHSPPAARHWYYLGAGLALWTSWQISTAVGIVFGAAVPPGWSLDFALALTFIGIVVPAARDRPHVGAALAAGLVAVLTFAWPYKLGLMAAAVTGILVGVALESRRPRAGRRVAAEEAGP